jgi:hypothetical protein
LTRKGRAGSSPAIGTKNFSGKRLLDSEVRQVGGTRRLATYGKSLCDAVDFYEAHLMSQASLLKIKLEPFVKKFLRAKEEGG